MKVYEIRERLLERTEYQSASELAKEINRFLKNSSIVTLSTSKKWWARQYVTPFMGEVLNVSVGYKGDFSNDALISALKNLGLEISTFPSSDNFYYIRKKE